MNTLASPHRILEWGLPGLRLLLIGLLLTVGPLLSDASAQWDSLEIERPSPAAQAKGGIQLVERDRPSEAVPYLEHALATDSLLVLHEHGAVAYWMGKAYAESGDSAQARSIWRRGFTQLENSGRFDVRLADAYLRTLTRSRLRNERLRAADAYFTLLGRVTPDTSTALKDVFRHRIAQIAPLMTDDVFAQTVEGERAAEPATWTFRPHAGDSLQAWWRGLDPFPDTPENERLEEHLTRLVHARQAFSCPENPGHLDRRGTVYLRLGAPYKRRELGYQDGEFFKEVFRFGVSIPPDAFPESEIWIYPQIDDSGFYLFAEEGTTDCFHLARTNDLLPNTLTMQRGKSERGLNHAYSALMAMRSIYRRLALYHISFSSRYSEIANYASYQEMEAKTAKMEALTGRSFGGGAQQQTTVGAGATARTVTENPVIGMEAPNHFVSRMVTRAQQEDEAAARRREENMPRQYTALYDDTPQLPVAVRTARFLTADGRTRTEVYWGVSGSAARLQPDEEDEDPSPSLIRFTATRQNADRSQVHRQNRHHQLSSEPSQQHRMFVPDPVSFEGLATEQHLSLQWTQHRLWQHADGSVAGLGPKRRFTTARIDSLGPLRASGPAPEMSDLKVLSLPDTSTATLAQLDERAVPYPFSTITPDTPLLLAFEVYHLTYGDDDQTRYSLSYEVEGKTRRGWTRFFRGEDTQRTTTEMTREGTSRRTEEQILIDLSQIEQEEAQDVRVTVEVTDEVTGSSITRSLDFVLRPRGDS